jgi:hypothetical protein
MKNEKIFKFEWDSDEITFDDIKKSLRLYYNNFLISHSIDNLQLTITEVKQEEENCVLELSLFSVPEYKMVESPTFDMCINNKWINFITNTYKLDILSDKRFNDLNGDERDDFIASMDAELDELNYMFVYQITEIPTPDGWYRYVLRGVK